MVCLWFFVLICKMSRVNSEDVELLKLYLEEFPEGISLDEILQLSRSCILEPELEKRLERVIREHKETLAGYVIALCSPERRKCRPGLAFSYGVSWLINNFEEVYGLEKEVKISKRKGILLRRVKRDNFKNPPKGLVDLGLVPRGLTAEQDGPYAGTYMAKVKRDLVPEVKSLGLGEEQIRYIIKKTDTLLQALPLLRY